MLSSPPAQPSACERPCSFPVGTYSTGLVEHRDYPADQDSDPQRGGIGADTESALELTPNRRHSSVPPRP